LKISKSLAWIGFGDQSVSICCRTPAPYRFCCHPESQAMTYKDALAAKDPRFSGFPHDKLCLSIALWLPGTTWSAVYNCAGGGSVLKTFEKYTSLGAVVNIC
jgi:hypothetical protein